MTDRIDQRTRAHERSGAEAVQRRVVSEELKRLPCPDHCVRGKIEVSPGDFRTCWRCDGRGTITLKEEPGK
jgi:hypothetical protein